MRFRDGSGTFERKLYVVMKRADSEVLASSEVKDKSFFYIPSLSSRTIIYKGLLLAPQIANFYKELSDPDAMSALCLVHQRFSTNTFPRGNWRIPSGWFVTTVRSTPFEAT